MESIGIYPMAAVKPTPKTHVYIYIYIHIAFYIYLTDIGMGIGNCQVALSCSSPFPPISTSHIGQSFGPCGCCRHDSLLALSLRSKNLLPHGSTLTQLARTRLGAAAFHHNSSGSAFHLLLPKNIERFASTIMSLKMFGWRQHTFIHTGPGQGFPGAGSRGQHV